MDGLTIRPDRLPLRFPVRPAGPVFKTLSDSNVSSSNCNVERFIKVRFLLRVALDPAIEVEIEQL
ncbi:hypothetical protein A2U01_0001414 [Trifolium medium]|uniref:Uncharacterized protein n=1 Tax=Trifolium medium TaxID=97028 RepID=A0A392M063_9FABA|nr:hypothetical protein [Trifolium medium]